MQGGYSPAEPVVIDEGTDHTERWNYNMSEPPVPNPYTQRFPLHQPPSINSAEAGGGPANNRSRFNTALVPDQDGESHRPQPYLGSAPALNPYAVFPPSPLTDQQRQHSSTMTPGDNIGSRTCPPHQAIRQRIHRQCTGARQRHDLDGLFSDFFCISPPWSLRKRLSISL